MSLTIHRMHTRLRTATAIAPYRLAAWQDEFGRQDGERIAARWAGPDEWVLIRHLPLKLRWRKDPADADVGRAWAEALAQAIARALERDDGNCVRYANRQAAVADLFYRAALGDETRQWAWQRMGLVPRAGLRSDEVLRHAAAELARTPELVWPVLMRLVEGEEATACLTAALRALPHESWLRLFEASPRSAGFVRALAAERAQGGGTAVEAAAPPRLASPAAQALLHWAAARALFVQRHRDVMAVLLCACERTAQGLTEASAERLVAIASRQLAALLPAIAAAVPAASAPAPGTTTPALAASPAAPNPVRPEQQPARHTAGDTPRQLPELPQPDVWLHTRFAGTLFWLSRLAVDPLLERLEDSDDALPLFLRELAFSLGVTEDDPVLTAFCGGTLPRGEAGAATIALAQRQAQEWERWLATAARELPEPRLLATCRRDGRLRIEPGWIELHLPLSAVETPIRRLGLDLDPGWLPWLGCVVRIIYEET